MTLGIQSCQQPGKKWLDKALAEAATRTTNSISHSGSANLEAMTLGIPHHQVREASSAVSKVRSQAPAHPTEDRAPQAGNQVLSTKDMGDQPLPGDREILPVTMRRGRLSGIPQTCPRAPFCWAPVLQAALLSPFSFVTYHTSAQQERPGAGEEEMWNGTDRSAATGTGTGTASSLPGP